MFGEVREALWSFSRWYDGWHIDFGWYGPVLMLAFLFAVLWIDKATGGEPAALDSDTCDCGQPKRPGEESCDFCWMDMKAAP